MKVLTALLLSGMAAAPAMHAQAPTAPAPPPPVVTANPVVWSANQIYARQSKYIAAAADQMPAEKYGYHPTPEQWTFAKIISHVAQSNGGVCGLLSDTPAPPAVKVSETAPKADLVAALKASFDFCGKVLDNLQDSKLGDQITYFRGARVPRARALIELTDDLEDHYSQLASYLRLNGMLPPSAAPPK
jgi:DinB superfamily